MSEEEEKRMFYRGVQEIKLTVEAFVLLFRQYCAERGLSTDSLQTTDNEIINTLRIEAIEIKEESKRVAEEQCILEKDMYGFRQNWIRNYKPGKTC